MQLLVSFSFQRKTVWHKLPLERWSYQWLSCVRLYLMDCNTQASLSILKGNKIYAPTQQWRNICFYSLWPHCILPFNICQFVKKKKILPIYFASHSLYFSWNHLLWHVHLQILYFFLLKTGYVLAIFFSWALLLFNQFVRIYIFVKIYIFLYIYNTIQKMWKVCLSFHNVCGKCFGLYFKLCVIGTEASLVQTELLTGGKHHSGRGAWRIGLKKTFQTVYGKGQDQANRSPETRYG